MPRFLTIPLVGFLPAHDPRVIGRVERISRKFVTDGLVMRYRTEADVDELPPGEEHFCPAPSGWRTNLMLAGHNHGAHELF